MLVSIPVENQCIWHFPCSERELSSIPDYLDWASSAAKVHSLRNQDVSLFCLCCHGPLFMGSLGAGLHNSWWAASWLRLGGFSSILECTQAPASCSHPLGDSSCHIKKEPTLIIRTINRASFKWLKSLKPYFIVLNCLYCEYISWVSTFPNSIDDETAINTILCMISRSFIPSPSPNLQKLPWPRVSYRNSVRYYFAN